MGDTQNTQDQTTTDDAAANAVNTTVENPNEGNVAPEGGTPNAQGAEVVPEGGKNLEDEVSKLKDESAQRRIKLRETEKELAAERAKGDEVIAMLRKLTGEESADGSTPEELLEAATKRAAAAESRIKELEQEQVLRGAIDGVAKPSIIPFLKGSGVLNDLNETDSDYAGLVKALISETVEKYPEFGATRVARSSGNTETPTENKSGQYLTAEDLKKMYANGEYEAVNKAFSEGRFKL